MPYRLDAFSDVGLDEALLRLVIDAPQLAALRFRRVRPRIMAKRMAALRAVHDAFELGKV